MGNSEPIDARSTGRKRARATLIRIKRPHFCSECGRGPTNLPSTFPESARNIELARPENRIEGIILEANHINKNILDNDPGNLEWLCKSCHKRKDQQTEKGVSIISDEYGYGPPPEF